MSTGGVRIERQGALAILRLDKGRGNAIDEPLAEGLSAAVAELAADDAVRGVLLASAHPKLFCPGLDLVVLAGYDRPAMARFMARFEEATLALFGLRKPLVASIAGTAVAGGCVLALTADLRLLREGAPIGLNEVRVGLPLPWWVAVLLRVRVPSTALTRVALLGENTVGEEARSLGLVDDVLPAEGFEAAALARLAVLAERDPFAFGTTKASLRHAALVEMRAGGEERAADFLDAWFSPAAQSKIRAMVATLAKKTPDRRGVAPANGGEGDGGPS